MKAYKEPSTENYFSKPPDNLPGEMLDYIVVQISEFRYVVAEWHGSMGAHDLPRLWNLVSGPLKYEEAMHMVFELCEARRESRERHEKLKEKK